MLRIEKLQRSHAVECFDCSSEPRFLIGYALQIQQAGASQTYVALSQTEVVGYHTLVVGQVEYDDAPERLTKGLDPVACASGRGRQLAGQGPWRRSFE